MSAQQSNADVAVVGLGRVGLPLALSFADRGLNVIGVDNDPRRLDGVREGRMPFGETGAEELPDRAHASGRLSLTAAVGGAATARSLRIRPRTPPVSRVESARRNITSA